MKTSLVSLFDNSAPTCKRDHRQPIFKLMPECGADPNERVIVGNLDIPGTESNY